MPACKAIAVPDPVISADKTPPAIMLPVNSFSSHFKVEGKLQNRASSKQGKLCHRLEKRSPGRSRGEVRNNVLSKVASDKIGADYRSQ